MGKIVVENVEINIWEKVEEKGGTHKIEGKYYTMNSTKSADFKSTIYFYEDIAVLVSKIKRYTAYYYKIVLFSDNESKAWTLIILSEKLDINIKRLGKEIFLIVAESKTKDVGSQISFCKLKPSEKVEEITINFTKLNDLKFLEENEILVDYNEFDRLTGKTTHVLSSYNNEGRMLKNYYEFDDDSLETYTYKIREKKVRLRKKTKSEHVINKNVAL